MPYLYFLSHARSDRENDRHGCIQRFQTDLDSELRLHFGLHEPAGFFDGTGIQQGDLWPDTLGRALRTCRSFLALYSLPYFNREFCGKEWGVFNSRIDSYWNAAPPEQQRPKLQLPVLFGFPEDLPKALPDAVRDLQFIDDAYPEVYRKNGLRYLMVREREKEAYQDFLDVLARRLIAALNAHDLPPLAHLPDIRTVVSAFHAPMERGAAATSSTSSPDKEGPAGADFLYVAAARSEMQSVRRSHETYGEAAGMSWRPFWPASSESIEALADAVATQEGFHYRRLPLDLDPMSRIREARNRRIVVLLVDPYALQISFYRDLVQRYAVGDGTSVAVLVLWNRQDTETTNRREELRSTVQGLFAGSSAGEEHRLLDGIESPEELKKSLGIVLHKVRMKIIETAPDLQKIESGPPILKPDVLAA